MVTSSAVLATDTYATAVATVVQQSITSVFENDPKTYYFYHWVEHQLTTTQVPVKSAKMCSLYSGGPTKELRDVST